MPLLLPKSLHIQTIFPIVSPKRSGRLANNKNQKKTISHRKNRFSSKNIDKTGKITDKNTFIFHNFTQQPTKYNI